MTSVAEPPVAEVAQAPFMPSALARADGVELVGPIPGSGYKRGGALVRRGDGQMVHLGPLMYALLACVDGRRDGGELAGALSAKLGRRVDETHVARIAQKLATQGLLAGTEHNAPPRRNPLLALRWKVLVTNPKVTERLTAPFTVFFRPYVMWPVLACFVGVSWFVLFHKGVASATAQAFNSPTLLLLVFVLAVVSAAFHELGHAAACRYGGATPGGMGMGLYLVWPAFYTDVTDAYRLPRRARLRVDLGGLYFNALIADVTMAVWLAWRVDALLLLVALQLLQMVKQLSPVIRADGYHILSDATGIPDLYAHMGPTLRTLVPGRRRESAGLTGSARVLVTLWVLLIVPVLLSLATGAVLVLPKLATSAWDSGRQIALAIPHEADRAQLIDILASLLRLVALALPVAGSALVTQKIVRVVVAKARSWSRGSRVRTALAATAGAAAVAGIVWAWWPSGQYQPVRASDGGTIGSFVRLGSPARAARPAAQRTAAMPGTHLAIAMIPVSGATKEHPAVFVIPGTKRRSGVAILSTTTPAPRGGSPAAGQVPAGVPAQQSAAGGPPTTASTPGGGARTVEAAAFPFTQPAPAGPGGTQALAVNTRDGGVKYAIAYALVTVTGGAPVTETNSAYAMARCHACTTVAVSFQVVLVVGHSNVIAPINAAGALNYDCPACITTAIADQIVVTLKAMPRPALVARIEADLEQLNALPKLGAGAAPSAVDAAVQAVQNEIDGQLANSGLPANQPSSAAPATASPPSTASEPAPSPPAQDPSASPPGTQTAPSQTTSSTSTSTTPQSPPSTSTSTSTSTTPSSTTTSNGSQGSSSGATSTAPSG
jgi:putative peptide zinc metalloprotease protein